MGLAGCVTAVDTYPLRARVFVNVCLCDVWYDVEFVLLAQLQGSRLGWNVVKAQLAPIAEFGSPVTGAKTGPLPAAPLSSAQLRSGLLRLKQQQFRSMHTNGNCWRQLSGNA